MDKKTKHNRKKGNKPNKKKLLIVCQTGGFLIVDIANAAFHYYEEVTLLTGGFSEIERKLDERVKVDSMICYDKSSTIKRIWTWVWATIQTFHKILWHYRDYDVYYFSNPPTSYFCSVLLKNKFRVAIWDLYPDGLMTINIGDNNIVSRIWAWFDRKAFNKAETVVTLADSMKQLMSKYCPLDRIRIAPLWSGSSQFKPIAKEQNPFVCDNGLENKFTVLYSGNIGWSHDVDVLVEVAKILKEDKDIMFVIIGEGKKKMVIEKMVKEYKLSNVIMLPFQPVDVLPYSLASADIGVVTLDEKVAKVAIPSKTFNLMAVGAPILAIANKETEIHNLISKYENGVCIPKSNVESIANYIIELKENHAKWQIISGNSLKAMECHAFDNALKYFE